MKHTQSGFSIVELAIALVIAALFIVSGFQLYSTVTGASGEARREATAGNVAYKIMRDQSYTKLSEKCGSSVKVSNIPPGSTALPPPVSIRMERCQVDTSLDLMKVVVLVRYGSPVTEVVHATYVTSE